MCLLDPGRGYWSIPDCLFCYVAYCLILRPTRGAAGMIATIAGHTGLGRVDVGIGCDWDTGDVVDTVDNLGNGVHFDNGGDWYYNRYTGGLPNMAIVVVVVVVDTGCMGVDIEA